MNIYLDHAATTPMIPEAIAALSEQISQYGNASSLHATGRAVRKKVEEARESIATCIGSDASEVIFTGSGTEANNLAIKGFYWKAVEEDLQRNVIVVAAFEHHAILEPIEWLEEHEGATVIYIPVAAHGIIELDALAEIIKTERDYIALICVMHSNNEIGTVQPVAEVVKLAGDIPVHTDAVQSFGKVPINFAALGVTSATISAHKIGGPLGVAALVLKRGVDITPVLHGGGQERDIRSGTINAPSIVAFAVAAQRAVANRELNYSRISGMRSLLAKKIIDAVPDARINGSNLEMLPGILNMTFPGTESDSLLLMLDNAGISTSTGSACSAGVQRPSHVLLALGMSEKDVRGSLRFSLGITTSEEEINSVGEVIADVVAKVRSAYLGATK
jgi:cysteine desulfurase